MDTPQLEAMQVLKQRGERLEKIRLLIHQTKTSEVFAGFYSSLLISSAPSSLAK